MKLFSRKLAIAAVAVVLGLGGSVVGASAAFAGSPTNCSYWGSGGKAHALCDGGSGAYRSIAVCKNIFGDLQWKYGPWKTPGNISTSAACPSGYPFQYAGLNKQPTP